MALAKSSARVSDTLRSRQVYRIVQRAHIIRELPHVIRGQWRSRSRIRQNSHVIRGRFTSYVDFEARKLIEAEAPRITWGRDAIREAWRHKKPIETELPHYT
ncbi:hypothetical protein PIB30_013820 [Stylosanthes scabra]|uniref:Uncharacterized protein n=1 Tax=Stylosanthes scabra TaxID=79078 RepID=A0ABU6S6B1_9FABA|nr:hypothetical protein [Stylosanthes scabra]